MKISFHGAARSVTGSRHVIDAGQTRVLLDCGIRPHPRKVFVVHGEERQSLAFAMTLRDEFPGMEVEVPKPESIHDI